VIGQRTRVYEVLRGKRSLSLNMIRELHDKFSIPASVLIQPGRKNRKTAGRVTSRRVRGAGLKKSE
jgi:HTH-type transcriptional regulator/antitoxin HigA